MTEYGYSRTSTGGQDGAGQLHVLAEAGIPAERVYTDPGVSGMKASRPQFDALLSLVTAGDVIVTPELSRLGRSVKNLLVLVDELNSRDVGLRILNLGGMTVDTRTPMGVFFLTVLMALSQLERDIIASRTRDELAARKVAGVQLGRPRGLTGDQVSTAARLKAQGVKVPDIASMLKVAPSTVYQYLAEARKRDAGVA